MADDFACYSPKFLIWWDPWVYIHFINGVILELFLKDWKLSILIGVAWEILETILMTFFRSYVLYGGDNDSYESASDSYLGDVLIGAGGVVITLVLRKYIVYIPQLIVSFENDTKLALVGLTQMVAILAVSSVILITQNTLFPIPENTVRVDVAIIIIACFQITAFAYMYLWTVRTPAYYNLTWGWKNTNSPAVTFKIIGIVIFLLAVPYFVKLPWTQVIAFVQVYLFLIVMLSISMCIRPVRHIFNTRIYTNERRGI